MRDTSRIGHRISRRSLVIRFAGTAALPALSGPFISCSPSPPQTAVPPSAPKAEPKVGGTLTVALTVEPVGLDYNYAADPGALIPVNLIFSRLVKPNLATGELQGDAAIEWKNVDPLTWQFTLRDGIKFHNGEPLDAASVKATFDNSLLSDKVPAASNVKAAMSALKSVEVVDRLTVVLRTSSPNSAFPTFLNRPVLYPAKYYAEQGFEGVREKPVGSGPFKFSSWTKGSALTLERFDGYFGEKAKLDRVIFKPTTEKSSRVSALQAGEIQIATNIDPDDVAGLRSQGFQIAAGPHAESWHLRFWPTDGSPTGDIRVRKAINHAIDRDALVKEIFGGLTRRLDSVVGPDIVGYNPDIKGYAYDPALAKALLKEAGYDNGFEIEFDSATAGGVKVIDVAQYLVGQLQRVGIRAKLNLMESGLFITKGNQGEAAPLTLHAMFFFPEMDIHRQFVSAVLPTLTRKDGTKFRRFYTSPELDKLLQEVGQTFDTDKRRKMLQQVSQVFFDTVPAAFLYQGLGLHGLAKNVQGFRVTPDTYLHLETTSLS